MYSITKLSCRYGDKIILDSISFNIRQNKTLVILGPGGSGKSTLLNYLHHELPEPLTTTNEDYVFDKKILGYLTQKHTFTLNTFEEIFADENFNLKEELKKIWNDKNTISLLSDHINTSLADIPRPVLKLLELTLFFTRHPDKEVLLLDEPEVSLHNDMSPLINKINSLNGEKTIIIVTHNVELAREVADDIMFLKYGEIIRLSDKKSFLASKNEQVKFLIERGC